MSYSNYQRHLATIRDKKKFLLKRFPMLDESMGIYMISRTDSATGKKICYVGQAKLILTRLAEHLVGYQAIDLSIKKHGIYEQYGNPDGYYFQILETCTTRIELDALEQKWIRRMLANGYELKNIAGGGQIDRAKNVNEQRPSRKYMDGLKQGEMNAWKEVKEFFDKYLEFRPKQIFAKPKRKNEEPRLQAIYVKKCVEFKQKLESLERTQNGN